MTVERRIDPDDYDTVGLDNIQISEVQRVVIVLRIINKFLGVARHPSDCRTVRSGVGTPVSLPVQLKCYAVERGGGRSNWRVCSCVA